MSHDGFLVSRPRYRNPVVSIPYEIHVSYLENVDGGQGCELFDAGPALGINVGPGQKGPVKVPIASYTTDNPFERDFLQFGVLGRLVQLEVLANLIEG
jgi:hypothetical protein